MLDKKFIELSQMQLQRALALLNESAVLISYNAYNSAVNRSYYAVFHALKAIEALDNFDSKRHTGVIQYFQQHYIKEGIFDKSFSGMIERLQTARGDSDYNITASFSLNAVNGYLDDATVIVKAIEQYLHSIYSDSSAS